MGESEADSAGSAGDEDVAVFDRDFDGAGADDEVEEEEEGDWEEEDEEREEGDEVVSVRHGRVE